MCFVSANNVGNTGVNFEIGFPREWLQDRRDQGAKIALIGVYLRALEFCAKNYSRLTSISLSDVERVALAGAWSTGALSIEVLCPNCVDQKR